MDIEYPEFDVSEIERRLAAWRPSSGSLDRDRMLYEAGRAAARADSRVRAWRLATAALALLTVGLGGLLGLERTKRRATETSIAIAPRINPAEPAGEIALPTSRENPAIEPFAPDSYFALTSRLSQGDPDMSSPDVEFGPGRQRPSTHPLERLPQSRPLQPGDLRRVLDL